MSELDLRDINTELALNDNWYEPPFEGAPETKTGTVQSFAFDPVTGLAALLLATHKGKDDQLFALSIDRETDRHDYTEVGTVTITCDRTGEVVFEGEITDATSYEDDDEYEAKVVTMDVFPENGKHYKLTLDLNEGGMDFSIEVA